MTNSHSLSRSTITLISHQYHILFDVPLLPYNPRLSAINELVVEVRMTSPAPTATTSATPATAPTPAASAPAPTGDVLPHATTLMQAARLAIQQDKPIQLDYYVETATNRAFIGEDPETKEKVLVKSREEFTSLVSKMYKVGEDFLIMTENSIYIVSGKIQKRKVNLSSLQGDE